ncbi:MAG: 23S rRNA (guanosine(2251)-2'-O)-methyltransferase RlmB [Nocardioidaceae bacterium]|nr:23S rRNA (guanosine(2251)-2'-O)-methyltransferase RlmB [Nocardioidaceae bacterium]
MAGNSKRQGAVRKKQGGNPTAGSGGRRRKALGGRGPTPKAVEREGHKAHRQGRPEDKPGRQAPPRGRRSPNAAEWVAGRNSVVEALQAGIPVSTMYVAEQIERDDRIREAFRLGADRGISMLEVTRHELDRMTDRAVHQGIALKVPSYDYADPHELVERAREASEPALLVALDSVTDPRNLGAVIRSAAAFRVHGVVIPERRAAGMTASAWKTSAGAAARVPVAQVTNLTRQLVDYQADGLMVAGLDADGTVEMADVNFATEPLVLVVGSEGKGMSRLVRDTCDVLVRIPMASTTESLNAGVAAGIALYEIDRRRSVR